MSELTKVRKSVMDASQVLPDMAGQSGKVLSNNGAKPQWIVGRFVGELIRVSFETPPPGCFALDGSRIVGGKNDFSALANSGSRFITISGNDLILADAVDFGRGKGSSGRSVGSFEGDAIRDITAVLSGRQGIVGGAVADVTRKFTVPSATTYPMYEQNFYASRVVPTAPENRPKSLTELVCIYHGVL